MTPSRAPMAVRWRAPAVAARRARALARFRASARASARASTTAAALKVSKSAFADDADDDDARDLREPMEVTLGTRDGTNVNRLARRVWRACVRADDDVVDATLGHGHDALALFRMREHAKASGAGGASARATMVYGFDIMDEALTSARGLFAREGVGEDRFTFVRECHSTMDGRVNNANADANGGDANADANGGDANADANAHVGVVCFNLGYLPSNDRDERAMRPRTSIDTTVVALHKALDMVRVGGVVTVVTYVKHDGGADEHAAVVNVLKSLSPKKFNCTTHAVVNRTGAPVLFAAIRIAK